MKTIYEEKGYRDRLHYLIDHSKQYNVTLPIVRLLADIHGQSEDFDGLVESVKTYAAMISGLNDQ